MRFLHRELSNASEYWAALASVRLVLSCVAINTWNCRGYNRHCYEEHIVLESSRIRDVDGNQGPDPLDFTQPVLCLLVSKLQKQL